MPDRNGTTPTSGSTPTPSEPSSGAPSQQPSCQDRVTDLYVADMTDHMLRQLGHQTTGGQP